MLSKECPMEFLPGVVGLYNTGCTCYRKEARQMEAFQGNASCICNSSEETAVGKILAIGYGS